MSPAYVALHAAMEKTKAHTLRSAQAIIRGLFGGGVPESVVDFGCGRGDWLRAAREAGAHTVLGIDPFGDDSAGDDLPRVRHDLTQPWAPDRNYGLSLCVEVAEHLPPAAMPVLVGSITRAAPLCVFSAAAPGQGGIGHLNERVPADWARAFHAFGFECLDLRARFWADDTIEPWYRQNLLVFRRPGHGPKSWDVHRTDAPLHLVHPVIFAGFGGATGKDVIWDLDDAGAWHARSFGPVP
ncbi:MAG: methyltransferase domain-containing protein [Myxococcaceae bacterium]|nr:methyltransferase domain-containing protein [Myxococcaceae bacterium]